jgi:hypothetical protein
VTSLLEPNIGEVLDRQSILTLKIEAGMCKGISTELWEREHADLDAYLTKKMQSWQQTATSGSTESLGRLTAELTIANTKLWVAEDELRALRQNGDSGTIAELAYRIADLNDARSRIIGELNQMFGTETQGKIYGG